MKVKIIVLSLLFFGITSCLKQKTEGVEVVNVASFEMKILDENVQLIDVRTPEEYAEGHLKNATNICVTCGAFEKEIEVLDKTKPVLVYCKMGGRSAKAAAKLKEQGFKSITDLDGGITAWKNEGKLIEN